MNQCEKCIWQDKCGVGNSIIESCEYFDPVVETQESNWLEELGEFSDAWRSYIKGWN